MKQNPDHGIPLWARDGGIREPDNIGLPVWFLVFFLTTFSPSSRRELVSTAVTPGGMVETVESDSTNSTVSRRGGQPELWRIATGGTPGGYGNLPEVRRLRHAPLNALLDLFMFGTSRLAIQQDNALD